MTKKKGFNSMEIAPPKATAAKKRKDEDTTEAKYDETKKVLILDVQKTLPTLSLSTSVAYYKHQMWTFNLGILDSVTLAGYMNVWSENLASRGAQEIGSCLLKHTDVFVSPTSKTFDYVR
jgi:hypothetical protein